jgi:hypothetical protein
MYRLQRLCYSDRSTATIAAAAPISGAATIAGGTAQPNIPPTNAPAIPTATPFPNPPPRRPESHDAASAERIAGPNQIDSKSSVDPGVGLPGQEDKMAADVSMDCVLRPKTMGCDSIARGDLGPQMQRLTGDDSWLMVTIHVGP